MDQILDDFGFHHHACRLLLLLGCAQTRLDVGQPHHRQERLVLLGNARCKEAHVLGLQVLFLLFLLQTARFFRLLRLVQRFVSKDLRVHFILCLTKLVLSA